MNIEYHLAKCPQKVIKGVFGCSLASFGNVAILTSFDRIKDYEIEMDKTDIKSKGWWKMITGTKDGVRISIIVCSVGASNAGECALYLSYTPCKTIFYTGAIGGLMNVKIGELIVPSVAAIGEGFSPYYIKANEVHPDRFLYNQAIRLLSSWKIPFLVGKIFTVSSMLAETTYFLRKLEKDNVIGIDMETSAVFTAGRIRGLPTFAIHYVSDTPATFSIFDNLPFAIAKRRKKMHEMMPKIVLELAKTIGENTSASEE